MRGERAGFTLVEVVIVLAILGVIGAVTAPVLARLGRQDQLMGSADEVARVLRGARMAALERAVPVSVIIDPAARKYLVKTDTDDGQLTLAEGTMSLPPGVTLTSERPRVMFAFSRLGSAAPDSLIVTGDGGTAVVGVERWSGEVSVRVDGRTGGRAGGRTDGRADRRTGGRMTVPMNRGFSLLEAVVALAIVGMATVAALGAFGVELRTSAQAGRALEAEALAQSRLASMRLLQRSELRPLADSMRNGRFPSPFEEYQWQASSEDVRSREDLFQVTVAVRWDGGAYSLASRLYRP